MAEKLHEPERTCVGCFKKFPQRQLLAVTKLKNNAVKFDSAQNLSGRSVYLCKNMACFQRATKRKGKNALAFGLKVDVSYEVLSQVEGWCNAKL